MDSELRAQSIRFLLKSFRIIRACVRVIDTDIPLPHVRRNRAPDILPAKVRKAVEDACKEVSEKKFQLPPSWAENRTLERLDEVEWLRKPIPDQVCPFENIDIYNVSQLRESIVA